LVWNGKRAFIEVLVKEKTFFDGLFPVFETKTVIPIMKKTGLRGV
jgi:hypothetical protein